MTIRQASIVFLTGIMLGAAIVGGCMSASMASVPTKDETFDTGPGTVPAPYYRLNDFAVMALPDSTMICVPNGGPMLDGRINLNCGHPLPHGCFVLIPLPDSLRQGN